jgi:nucleoside phosphorylase
MVAFNMILQEAFDAVIIDIDLSAGGGSSKGGFLLVEKIKAKNIQIPVILASCFLDPLGINRAERLDVFQSLMRRGGTEYLDQLKDAIQLKLSQSKSPSVQTSVPEPNPVGRKFRTMGKIPIEQIRNGIDISIITMRDDEFTSVLAHFADAKEVEGGKRPYFYSVVKTNAGTELGVVIGRCLDQGNGPAQGMASNMIRDFSSPWILLVGIAGGVPDDEFSLGDVLLASRVYDFSVSAALPGGRSEFNLRGGSMHKDVRNLLEKIPAYRTKKELAGWNDTKFLKTTKPILTAPEHLNDERLFGSESWKQKVLKSIKRHFPDRLTSRPPNIWVAPTASGNVLVKDPALVEKLKQSVRSFCTAEMELAGVYEAVYAEDEQNHRVLAVRGLSDIVGFNRDGDWTEFACHSASAVAHKLILGGLIPKVTRSMNCE